MADLDSHPVEQIHNRFELNRGVRHAAHADEITCVILDLTMPHVDGEECYRELRRIRGDVRVILSSGYNEQEIAQRFAGKGLAGFIQKPYGYDALIAVLGTVLGE